MLLNPKLTKLPPRPPDLLPASSPGGADASGLVLNQPLDIAALAGDAPEARSSNLTKALAAAGIISAITGAATGSAGLASFGGGLAQGAGIKAREDRGLDARDTDAYNEVLRDLAGVNADGERANVKAQNDLNRDAKREEGLLNRQQTIAEFEGKQRRELEEFKAKNQEFNDQTKRITANAARQRAANGATDGDKPEKFKASAQTKDIFATYKKWKDKAIAIHSGAAGELDSPEIDTANNELVSLTHPMLTMAMSYGITLDDLQDMMEQVRKGRRTEEEFEAVLGQLNN